VLTATVVLWDPSQITTVDLSVLTLDKVKMIIDSLLPSAEEEAVTSYSGPLEELSKVDQYYFTMAQIPRCARRVLAVAGFV
jgi:hypothetical protein